LYLKNTALPSRWAARVPWLYNLLARKYYVDEIYGAVIVNPLVQASEWTYRRFDLGIIDAAVDGTAKTAGFFGKAAGILQTGLIKDYALAILLGVLIFLGVLLF
jgi:NADH-quinone oxidoreductase subunit L